MENNLPGTGIYALMEMIGVLTIIGGLGYVFMKIGDFLEPGDGYEEGLQLQIWELNSNLSKRIANLESTKCQKTKK